MHRTLSVYVDFLIYEVTLEGATIIRILELSLSCATPTSRSFNSLSERAQEVILDQIQQEQEWSKENGDCDVEN